MKTTVGSYITVYLLLPPVYNIPNGDHLARVMIKNVVVTNKIFTNRYKINVNVKLTRHFSSAVRKLAMRC